MGAVRRAGVDDAGLRIGDQGGRLLRCSIRQAEESHIGGVEQAGPFGHILAAIGLDAQYLDVRPLGQNLMDAQAGRAFLAVNKNFERHGGDVSDDLVGPGNAWQRANAGKPLREGIPTESP